MKDKLIAFSMLTILIVGSALLHIAPVVSVLAIASHDELTRALGLVVLLSSIAALVRLHHLNGSFRSPKRRISLK